MNDRAQESGRFSAEGAAQVRSPQAGVRIRTVTAGSTAEEVELKAGDLIEAVNGEPIRDPIDFRFHIADELVEMVVRRGGEVLVLELEKDADDDLGVLLDDMPILKCDNKCVFCFLHQMPKGMRKTLYYQDDDYRLSFLHGAYVTLTNVSEEELARVVRQRLSPIYISVHATNPGLRAQLLGRPDPADVMDRIHHLARHGIQMHTQVVLCPGMNDGEHLKRTVHDLAGCYPDVASVGVVPLGLTRFRKNLPALDPVTPAVAADTVNAVAAWQGMFKRKLGVNFVYLGDEFYLMSGRDVPGQPAYDGFPLVENGVGMVRRFVDAFGAGFGRLRQVTADPMSVKLVTGVLGQGFLGPLARMADTLPWLSCRVVPVRNRFFGHGITVSGLLTGADIVEAVKQDTGAADVILLPPNCVNHEGVLLDDAEPTGIADALNTRVVLGTYDLADALLGLTRPGPEPDRVHLGFDLDHPYIASHQLDP